MRPVGTPNTNPPVVNTMDMYYSNSKEAKKAEAARRKQLKLNKDKQFADAKLVLVNLLVPPTAYRDELRLMPEQELLLLQPVELAQQAMLLMTADDPHGLIACGGTKAVDQCIAEMAALTTRVNKRAIDKLFHEKNDALLAVKEVQDFENSAHQEVNDDAINEDAGNESDSDPPDDADDDISDTFDYDDYLEIIDQVDNASSSRVPPALSTLGVETIMGGGIQRPADKRHSKGTPMFGQFHGKEQVRVLSTGFDQHLGVQRKSNKSTEQVAGKKKVSIEQIPFPPGVLPSKTTVVALPADTAGQDGAAVNIAALPTAGQNVGLVDSSVPFPQNGSLSPSSNVEDNADDGNDEGVGEDDEMELMFKDDNVGLTQDINEDSEDSGDLDDPVGGRNSELVAACFRASPELDLQHYREPGAITTNGAGPLQLKMLISPAAPTLLAVHPDDAVVLSERCRNYSFVERATFLHRTWDALHQYTSLEQLRKWLERLAPPGHILLVLSRAAYLNCQPDYLATFGVAKSSFWDMANAFGDFSSGTFVIQRSVALAEVTVPYFLVRSLRDWVNFCTTNSVCLSDFWNMTPSQELQFAALDVTVYPTFDLCMAMLIRLVNFCSNAYRHEIMIETLLQRQVYPCTSQPESGLSLLNVDANLAMQCYFPEETAAAQSDEGWGRARLSKAVAWAKQQLSVAAIKSGINHRWLQLLSALFSPTGPYSIVSHHEQVQVLRSINPILFADNELRTIYPTVRKGPPHQLLEYLNNSAMAASLYGQSKSTECFGILCLKLMGCLVAILQRTHGVRNVDNFLSVTDIAFLMHDGGVLSSAFNHHAFESTVYYIFDPASVQDKLKRLVFSKRVMPIVSVPRSFQALTSKRAWWSYYKSHVPDDNAMARKSKRRHDEVQAQISIPEEFAITMPHFKISCQDKAELQAASPDNYVRILANVVFQTLSQVPASPAVPRMPAPSTSTSVDATGAAIIGSPHSSSAGPIAHGTELAATINLQPPLPVRTAVYGNIQARRRERYDDYVLPSTLAIEAQQNITHWETIRDFVFEPEGDAYMRSLALCVSNQRSLAVTDNIVFLYDPANRFTPQDPFPSISEITHLWYRIVATDNGWHYFDFVEVLCKTVSSTVVPLKIKLQYSGTYLLYSPPTAVVVTPAGLQPTQPPVIPTSSLMGPAPTTIHGQQQHPPAYISSAPAQSSVVAAAHAYTRSIGVSPHPTQSLMLMPAPSPCLQQVPSSPAITQAQATGYDSDDSDVKAMIKIAQVPYEGKNYPVLGKESVIKILRETQSVRALMETGQLEKLVHHEGNFVNNYTPSVFRAGLLRQNSLASIQLGMTLIVNDNHDLVRFQSLVCYDVPELQRSLYTLKHDFPYQQTSTSLHPVHYLTKADASACNYDIRTYDMWVKIWEGYKLALKLILGPSYGLAIASIITDIQQHNIGQLFDVDYLLALTATLMALLHNYAASTEPFTVTSSTFVFQPATMVASDWQQVIALLWVAFKSQLTFGLQQEVNMTRARYNQVKGKPVQYKHKAEVQVDHPPKEKQAAAHKQKRARSPPANRPKVARSPPAEKAAAKKVDFAATDINICISDIARHYKVKTELALCAADCKYVHYSELPPTMTTAVLVSKVEKLAERCKLSDKTTAYFLAKINADKRFK